MKTAIHRITVDPQIMNGQPCIRGMRLTVRRVLRAIALQPDRRDLQSEYPELEDEDIQQALEYAARNLDDVLYLFPRKTPEAVTSHLLDRITVTVDQCGSRPCIRGMRIRAKDVLDMLADGASQEEILADFPDLEPEDVRASIEYAACYLDQ